MREVARFVARRRVAHDDLVGRGAGRARVADLAHELVDDACGAEQPPAPFVGLVRARVRAGAYFDVEVATKEAIESELAESDVRWLAPGRENGQAWLDSYRRRVAEVILPAP